MNIKGVFIVAIAALALLGGLTLISTSDSDAAITDDDMIDLEGLIERIPHLEDGDGISVSLDLTDEKVFEILKEIEYINELAETNEIAKAISESGTLNDLYDKLLGEGVTDYTCDMECGVLLHAYVNEGDLCVDIKFDGLCTVGFTGTVDGQSIDGQEKISIEMNASAALGRGFAGQIESIIASVDMKISDDYTINGTTKNDFENQSYDFSLEIEPITLADVSAFINGDLGEIEKDILWVYRNAIDGYAVGEEARSVATIPTGLLNAIATQGVDPYAITNIIMGGWPPSYEQVQYLMEQFGLFLEKEDYDAMFGTIGSIPDIKDILMGGSNPAFEWGYKLGDSVYRSDVIDAVSSEIGTIDLDVRPVLDCDDQYSFEYTVRGDDLSLDWYSGPLAKVPAGVNGTAFTEIQYNSIYADRYVGPGGSTLIDGVEYDLAFIDGSYQASGQAVGGNVVLVDSITVDGKEYRVDQVEFNTKVINLTVRQLPSLVYGDRPMIINLTFENTEKIDVVHSSMIPGMDYLESVRFLGDIGSIENQAFYGMTEITKLEFGSEGKKIQIDTIEYDSFAAILLREIIFNANIGTIESNAFASASMLESLYFNGSVGQIDEDAFIHCDSLNTISFGGSIGIIGYQAFPDNNYGTIDFIGDVGLIDSYAFGIESSIANLCFKGDIDTIGAHAFSNIVIENLDVQSSKIKEIHEFAFISESATHLDFEDTTIEGYISPAAFEYTEGSYEPGEVLVCGNMAIGEEYDGFTACYSLYVEGGDISAVLTELYVNSKHLPQESISFVVPDTVSLNGIEYEITGAFIGVGHIESVRSVEIELTFGPGIERIGNNIRSISENVSLKGINVTDNSNYRVETITDGSQSGFGLLTDSEGEPIIAWGDGKSLRLDQEEVDLSVYAGLELDTLILGDGVRTVTGWNELGSIKNLEIGKNVESIESENFPNTIVNVTVDAENQRYSSQDGVLYEHDGNEIMLKYYPRLKTDAEYVVPDKVTTVYYAAFGDNDYLTKITFPQTIWSFASGAFTECRDDLKVVSTEGVNVKVETKDRMIYLYRDYDQNIGKWTSSHVYGVIGSDHGVLAVNEEVDSVYISGATIDMIIVPGEGVRLYIGNVNSSIEGVRTVVLCSSSSMQGYPSDDVNFVTYNSSSYPADYDVDLELQDDGSVKLTVNPSEYCTLQSIQFNGSEFTNGSTVTLDQMRGSTKGFEIDVNKQQYTVTFDTGTDVISDWSEVVYVGDCVNLKYLEVGGRQFIGWSSTDDSDNLFDSYTPITGDITLYAVWKIGATVTYMIDGVVYDEISVNAGSYMTLEAAPSKEGHRFAGWVIGHALYYGEFYVMDDVTFTAGYVETTDDTPEHKVRFVVNPLRGQAMQPLVVKIGDYVEIPDAVANSGYRFTGWVDILGNEVDGSVKVDRNMLLTAQFVSVGGSSGGSSSGGSSGGTTVTNPDGSTTTTVTNPDGSKTETTENSDGSKTEVTQNPDGSKTETNTNKDGSSVSTETKPIENGTQVTETVKDSFGNVTGSTEKTETTEKTDAGKKDTVTTVIKDSDGNETESVTQVKIESEKGDVTTVAETKKDKDGNVQSTVSTTITAETDTSGKIALDDSAVDDAVKQIDEATGGDDAEKVIEVSTKGYDPDKAEVQMTPEALKKVTESGAEMKISGEVGSIQLSKDVSSNLASKEEAVSVSISKADKTGLNNTQTSIVGDKPVFELRATVGENESIHELGGTVKVSIPYVLKDGEDPRDIRVYYVDDDGNLHVKHTVYDAETHTVYFETDHFSYYMIGNVSDSPESSGNSTVMYAAVAAIAAVAVIGAVVLLRRKA